MSNAMYLIIGTSAMIFMMFAIVLFVYVFQRKLATKAAAYLEIEKLMQKQELQSAYALIEGQESERKRIAAELHDNIGGLMATLKIYSDLSLEKSDLSDVRRLNLKMNEITDSLSEEVRKLSHELDLRTLSGFGFKAAVQHLCEAITASGRLQVTLILEMANPVNETISLNLYRIVQELFTNTLKHADATEVRLEVTLIGIEITLIYEDNGKGFDLTSTHTNGMGLDNINSRVSILNARLTLDSSNRGTTYIIELEDHE